METLKKVIDEKIPTVATALLKNRTVLHLKGLDATATEEDIEAAVLGTNPDNPQDLQIRAIRPAYGGSQNVPVIMPEPDANKLLRTGKLKIGWLNCTVTKRKTEAKCFRCWDYGHMRAQCTGPDRQDQCIKCCKEGHKAAHCKN